MRFGIKTILSTVAITLAALACLAADPTPTPTPTPRPAGQFRSFDCKFYTIVSDLDDDAIREATIRMDKMAEVYTLRTRGFAGAVRGKMAFKLFSNIDDYHKAGGMSGTAGVFDGKELKAAASAGDVWHTVQHEGFHQFARLVITPRLPAWLNEGLAEYFGEAVWTGEGMVPGVIPPARLKRIKDLIAQDKLLAFDKMVTMSREEWNKEMSHRNYDQGWAMTHFLAHADNGKYQEALVGYINDIAKGADIGGAFVGRFGKDTAGFQKRFCDWWKQLDDNPTSETYARATVETMTAYLARATVLKQNFATAEEFFQAAGEGKLHMDPKKGAAIWLPDSLLERALADAKKIEGWSLVTAEKKPPKLVLTLQDGTVFTGSFLVSGQSIFKFQVDETKPKPTPSSKPGPATDPASMPA